MKGFDISEEKQNDRSMVKPKVLQDIWVFRIKRFSTGIMRKIKTRFCARDELQNNMNMFETYAPLASWKSIRMFILLFSKIIE